MKKLFSLLFIVVSILILSACTKPGSMFSISFFDYMDTFISINVYAEDQSQADEYKVVIEDIYSMYHELTTNYEPLKTDSTFLENIYSINRKNNQVIEIDFELYELIQKAEEIKVLTDGYFDISVGEVVNIWKNLILDETSGYLFEEIPESIFLSAMSQINLIQFEEDVVELTENNGRYYVQVKSTHAQLDLGAISKGYATQKVFEYLQELDMEYFSISAGSSSIAIGKNMNRDGGIFNVSLANPIKTGANDRTYGMIYVKDIGITTSGNYEQYALYQGLRYHHIVSPKTKLPMQYYHTITVLGDDLGLLDAISTAMFSMPPEVLEQWLSLHREAMNLEVIQFNYDGTILTHMTTTVFEENVA
ncbi:MAG: FAD:protein FMN transferase [Acholeplasmataceae bacterium]|nr:FAD:protein FMN transferase [Acholeplasmataceae bacterium]